MLVNRHMHKASGFAAFAALAGIGFGAHATQLDVSATVADACSVNPGALAFGEYGAGVAGPNSLAGSGSFSVTCASPANVNILLDGGMHHGAGSNGRAMLGSQSGHFLDYKLYQGTAGQSAEWGDDSLTSKNFPSIGATTTIITVEGLIAADQLVGGGNYSDIVGITLVFNP